MFAQFSTFWFVWFAVYDALWVCCSYVLCYLVFESFRFVLWCLRCGYTRFEFLVCCFWVVCGFVACVLHLDYFYYFSDFVALVVCFEWCLILGLRCLFVMLGVCFNYWYYMFVDLVLRVWVFALVLVKFLFSLECGWIFLRCLLSYLYLLFDLELLVCLIVHWFALCCLVMGLFWYLVCLIVYCRFACGTALFMVYRSLVSYFFFLWVWGLQLLGSLWYGCTFGFMVLICVLFCFVVIVVYFVDLDTFWLCFLL